jgi:hypothetical protein
VSMGSQWIDGESGPTCLCGWPTIVTVTETGPVLLCFGHSKHAGRSWRLPKERPDNWPDLTDDEMETVIREGLAECALSLP